MSKRKKQAKFLTVVEGILFTLFFISICAMDSQEITIPSVVFVTSAVGLFIACKLEEGRSKHELHR